MRYTDGTHQHVHNGEHDGEQDALKYGRGELTGDVPEEYCARKCGEHECGGGKRKGKRTYAPPSGTQDIKGGDHREYSDNYPISRQLCKKILTASKALSMDRL